MADPFANPPTGRSGILVVLSREIVLVPAADID